MIKIFIFSFRYPFPKSREKLKDVMGMQEEAGAAEGGRRW
jgi:hypothetical protein